MFSPNFCPCSKRAGYLAARAGHLLSDADLAAVSGKLRHQQQSIGGVETHAHQIEDRLQSDAPQQSAVHLQSRTRDVGRGVGEQKHSGRCKLVRIPVACHGNLGGTFLALFIY